MTYIGIDPGKRGAVVGLTGQGEIYFRQKTPLVKSPKGRDEYDITGMIHILRSLRLSHEAVAALEKAQPLPPKMGGSLANYQRGYGYGIWQTILVATGTPYRVVAPRTWQAVMLRDMAQVDTKQASVLAAQRMWPNVDFRASDRARKPDDGLTDAALIARWLLMAERGERICVVPTAGTNSGIRLTTPTAMSTPSLPSSRS